MSLATLDVRFTRFVDAQGRLAPEAPLFAQSREELVALHRGMTRTRTFDAKAIALQRTGRIGTFASSLGQEAVSVGIGSAMRSSDVLLPSFREQGAQLWRGVRPVELLQYWGGDERGSRFADVPEDFPNCLPVGSHAPHAIGVALAFKLRREPRVAVCVLGDGATSKGDVYEAMNVAGSWQLPVVFVINNNQWAISMPRAAQSGAKTLAQKSIAAGFEGEQVDGNDVVAVRHVLGVALERARQAGGPSCIEALTYRMGEHTTADDSSRYRDRKQVEEHVAQDPITRLRTLLQTSFAWTQAEEQALRDTCTEEMNQAAEAYLTLPKEPPEAMFDFLYATLPEAYRAQRAQVAAGHDHE